MKQALLVSCVFLFGGSSASLYAQTDSFVCGTIIPTHNVFEVDGLRLPYAVVQKAELSKTQIRKVKHSTIFNCYTHNKINGSVIEKAKEHCKDTVLNQISTKMPVFAAGTIYKSRREKKRLLSTLSYNKDIAAIRFNKQDTTISSQRCKHGVIFIQLNDEFISKD